MASYTFAHDPYNIPGYVCFAQPQKEVYEAVIQDAAEDGHSSDGSQSEVGEMVTAEEIQFSEDHAPQLVYEQFSAQGYVPPYALRRDLVGHCPFVAYPAEASINTTERPTAPYPRPAGVVQMFLGQAPFRVTDRELLFMFRVLVNTDILFIERVVQGDSRKGCIQIFIAESAVEAAQAAIHKRVLFDYGGFWVATNDDQQSIIALHCQRPDLCRHRGLPFNTAVLERATSTFTLAVVKERTSAEHAARGAKFNPSGSTFRTCALGASFFAQF